MEVDMSLVKWNSAANLFPTITNWMDDFFEDTFFEGIKPMVKGITIPAANITETNDAFRVEMAAPGFEKQEFKIEEKDGYLHISGEHKVEKTEKDAKFTRREFQFASFKRAFALPDNVDTEKIAANYDNGMLKLTLPKLTAEEPKDVRKIAVN